MNNKNVASLEAFEDASITKSMRYVTGGEISDTHQGTKTLSDGTVITWSWDLRSTKGGFYASSKGTPEEWMKTADGMAWVKANS